MYSHIMLHLDLVFRGEHDLFFIGFVRAMSPAWWLVPAFLLALVGGSAVLLVRHLRDAREPGLRYS
jgi:hypothetical protein